MNLEYAFSRRTALTALASGVGSVILGSSSMIASAGVTQAVNRHPSTSLNGWVIATRTDYVSTVWTRPVPGTALSFGVRLGLPETCLMHLIRRVHYEIFSLQPGDLVGWGPLGDTPLSVPASNLSSGTAIRIRPGARFDAYYPCQLEVLRDILTDLDGLVRWGGDDRSRDESLFYLSATPAEATAGSKDLAVSEIIMNPGKSAGTLPDPRDPERWFLAKAAARAARF